MRSVGADLSDPPGLSATADGKGQSLAPYLLSLSSARNGILSGERPAPSWNNHLKTERAIDQVNAAAIRGHWYNVPATQLGH